MPGLSNFPGALDVFQKIEPTTQEDSPGFEHDVMHNKAFDAIAALQEKVGTDVGAAPSSVEARIAALEAASSQMAIVGVLQNSEIGEESLFAPQLVGGSGSERWDVVAGTLPPGISIDPVSGRHTGVFSTAGSYSWLIGATSTTGSTVVSAQKVAVTLASKPIHLETRGTVLGEYSQREAYFPTGYVEGDLMILCVTHNVPVPSGWTRIGSVTSVASMMCAYRVMNGNEGAYVTIGGTSQSSTAIHRIKAGTFDPNVAPQIAWNTGTSKGVRDVPSMANPWETKTLFVAAVNYVQLNGPVSVTGWPLPDHRTHAQNWGGASVRPMASCSVVSADASISPPPFVVASSIYEVGHSDTYSCCLIAVRPQTV